MNAEPEVNVSTQEAGMDHKDTHILWREYGNLLFLANPFYGGHEKVIERKLQPLILTDLNRSELCRVAAPAEGWNYDLLKQAVIANLHLIDQAGAGDAFLGDVETGWIGSTEC